MSTYRTGNHSGVTIVHERKHGGQCAGGICFESDFTDECDCWCHGGQPEAELAAVVVNGDLALAERICTLLNGDGYRRVIATPADVGPALADSRELLDVQRSHVAGAVDMYTQQYAQYERGDVVPSLPVLLRIAGALGYDLALVPRQERA